MRDAVNVRPTDLPILSNLGFSPGNLGRREATLAASQETVDIAEALGPR